MNGKERNARIMGKEGENRKDKVDICPGLVESIRLQEARLRHKKAVKKRPKEY